MIALGHYAPGAALEVGLFVPKPSCGADCQHRGAPDLGAAVRQRPLTSTARGGDCYSLGYSAPVGARSTALAVTPRPSVRPDSTARVFGECRGLPT